MSYQIRISEALSQAWAIFARAPEVFVGITFGLFVVSWILTPLPLVGTLIGLLLWALSPAAFYLAAESGQGERPITFDCLQRLPQVAPQMLALFVAKYILIGLGLLLLVLPGLYLAVIFAYAELFVVLEGRSFLEALRASQQLANQNLLGTFGLLFFTAVLAAAGALLIGIGLLVTMPLAMLVLYCVFRRVHIRVV